LSPTSRAARGRRRCTRRCALGRDGVAELVERDCASPVAWLLHAAARTAGAHPERGGPQPGARAGRPRR
jgi:hypothetical protein